MHPQIRTEKRHLREDEQLWFLYHFVDLGYHCNVGATADTFGCWQGGDDHFKTRYWQNQAGGAMCSAWKITKVKQKRPTGTKKVAKVKQRVAKMHRQTIHKPISGTQK